jgi:peptidoglycan/xylan/chitin deacetylase (PgdA/CDA1 family)
MGERVPRRIPRPWREVVGAGALIGTFAGVRSLPAVLILPTFLSRPPAALGRWCRWRGQTSKPAVALTFDDGPAADTVTTLELLAELHMRATFFVLGRQLEAHPDLVVRMEREGHEVGIHGFEHRSDLLVRARTTRADLQRAVDLYTEVLGHRPHLFRPPYGHITTATLREVRRHGLDLVLWSTWGKEFAEHEVGPVMARLQPGLRPGAILLLHDNDVSCPAGTSALTHDVMPHLRRALTDKGLGAVTVGELLQGSTPRGPARPRPHRMDEAAR